MKEHGIAALLLDIDNTLTFDFDPELPEAVARWLAEMKAACVKGVIISNNSAERAEPFAKKCALPYVADAHKPSPRAFERAKALLSGEGKIAMVGDQLFTDMAFGNGAGCVTIFVEPMGPERLFTVKLKRLLEKPFMPLVRKRGVR